MRVILDENVPHPLIARLTGHLFSTVQQEGWSGKKNGELLNLIEAAGWDVFVTADQSVQYQQNLQQRLLAIIQLPSNRWPVVQGLVTDIQDAIDNSQAGTLTQL